MKRSMRALLLSVALTAAGGAIAAANAAAVPAGWKAQNMAPVGYIDMEHRFAFKLTVKEHKGRWYLFSSYAADDDDNGRPGSLVVFDVTDPANPKRIKQVEGPPHTEMGQVSLHGDLLVTDMARRLTTYDTTHPINFMSEVAKPRASDAPFEEGIQTWDVSDPADPKPVGKFGMGANGTHRNSYPGGRYAFLSSSVPGFKGNQLVIVDVSDPKAPKLVSTFVQHGQKEGEVLGERELLPSFHGPASLSPDGKMLTLGYTPDVLNLDISDIEHPKVIGRLQMIPPFAYNVTQSVHTVLPYWDRRLLYVNGEPKKANCNEPMPLQAMVDNADPAHPKLISVFPQPEPPAALGVTNFCDRPGRFGPHNISTEIHNPDVARPGDIVHVAYFNAGMQVFDIKDARLPKIVGYFIPADSPQPERSQSGMLKTYIAQDTLTDRRGYIYLLGSGGLYVLRDTGALVGRSGASPASPAPVAHKPKKT